MVLLLFEFWNIILYKYKLSVFRRLLWNICLQEKRLINGGFPKDVLLFFALKTELKMLL